MPPTAEVTAEVSPARSYPELFRVTGPPLSLVFRTEDVWQRYNQFIETAGALNQGFPFCISIKSNDHLTPTMQTGQDSDGGVDGLEGMCTLHAVVVLWFGTKGVSCLGVFCEKASRGPLSDFINEL